MMLKTSDNEYIEVPDVEMERQAKLFDSVADTAGDFSYTFEFDNNSENRRKLNIVSPVDGFDKSIYRINDIKLCDDNGSVIYTGYLQIQTLGDTFEASFFSGNNNWFAMMTGNMIDMDYSEFNLDITKDNIEDSWDNTDGVIFPMINTGAFSTRSSANFKVEDFQPFIYVKNLVDKCFTSSGLKLTGNLLYDWRYSHLITSTNRKSSAERAKERTVKVSKTIDQTINIGAYEVVTFEIEDDVGDLGLWDNTLYRYTADVRMEVNVTYSLTTAGTSIFPYLKNIVCVNGDEVNYEGSLIIRAGFSYTKNFPDVKFSLSKPIVLEAGDYLDIRGQVFGSFTIDIINASLTITPVRILNVSGEILVPDVSKIEFVTDVFKLFNTVIDFNPFTKTVSVDTFKSVAKSEEIDISQYVDPETVNIDYQELISDYARINNLTYSEADSDSAKEYNTGRVYKYGSGQIDSGNDFGDKTKDILESIFVASVADEKNPLNTPMVNIGFTELDKGTEYDGTITSSGGALITIGEDFFPESGELVEIFESTVDSYLGQWTISSTASDTEFYVDSLVFESNATIRIRRIQVVAKDNSDQVLLLVVPSLPAATSAYLSFERDSAIPDPAIAYFYSPEIIVEPFTALNDYNLSLSFGENDVPLAYQKTMIEDYWADFAGILQDPIKVFIDANLPKPVFDSITFKNPLRVKTDKFNTRFFPNRLTGYKDSSQPMTAELIKLPQ